MVRLYNAPAGFAPAACLCSCGEDPAASRAAQSLVLIMPATQANGIGGLLYVEGGSVSVLPGHGVIFASFWENLRLRLKDNFPACRKLKLPCRHAFGTTGRACRTRSRSISCGTCSPAGCFRSACRLCRRLCSFFSPPFR